LADGSAAVVNIDFESFDRLGLEGDGLVEFLQALPVIVSGELLPLQRLAQMLLPDKVDARLPQPFLFEAAGESGGAPPKLFVGAMQFFEQAELLTQSIHLPHQFNNN